MADWNSITYDRISLPKFPEKSFSTATPDINSWVWRCSSQRQHEGHNDGREQHGLNADEENDTRQIGRRHRRGRRAAMDDALRSLRRLAKIAAERSAA